jgi:hypothetical protein
MEATEERKVESNTRILLLNQQLCLLDGRVLCNTAVSLSGYQFNPLKTWFWDTLWFWGTLALLLQIFFLGARFFGGRRLRSAFLRGFSYARLRLFLGGRGLRSAFLRFFFFGGTRIRFFLEDMLLRDRFHPRFQLFCSRLYFRRYFRRSSLIERSLESFPIVR